MTLRGLLCRLVIEEWVTLRRYPTESVWLSLLNHLDGVTSTLPRLLPQPDQVSVKLGNESEKSSVFEVEVLRHPVGEIEFLDDVQSKRDEVLNLILKTLQLHLKFDVIVTEQGEIDPLLNGDDPLLSRHSV